MLKGALVTHSSVSARHHYSVAGCRTADHALLRHAFLLDLLQTVLGRLEQATDASEPDSFRRYLALTYVRRHEALVNFGLDRLEECTGQLDLLRDYHRCRSVDCGRSEGACSRRCVVDWRRRKLVFLSLCHLRRDCALASKVAYVGSMCALRQRPSNKAKRYREEDREAQWNCKRRWLASVFLKHLTEQHEKGRKAHRKVQRTD